MRVLIVDDHPIVRSGLSALLAEADGFAVVSAGDSEDGRRLFLSCKPDVTLIDINLPFSSGFDLTKELLDVDPNAKILIFSMNDDPGVATTALDIGALGFLSKNDDPSLVRDALDSVAHGNVWLRPEMAQKIAAYRACRSRLSSREVEVLRHLSRGRSMAEIAELLEVSYKTVATDCAAVRRKLDARTRVEMVRIAVERKLV